MSDSCSSLSAEIAALRRAVADIKSLTESQVKSIVQNEINPKITEITYRVDGVVTVANEAAGTANNASQKVSTFEGAMNQMNRSIQGAVSTAGLARGEAAGAKSAANVAIDNLAGVRADYAAAQKEQMRISREAKLAQIKANQASYTASAADIEAKTATSAAGTSTKVANNAFDKAAQAQRKTELLEAQANGFRNKLNNVEDVAIVAARESKLASGVANQADLKAAKAVNRVTTVERTLTTVSGKAQDALGEAAKAVRASLNTASEVSGIKGIVEGVKGTVGKLGNAVAKVEKVAGDAITKAAKAVGISSEALGATARLGGKILEIFNVIGTIFSILDGMATRELLGARMDAVEAGLAALGRDVSSVLGRIFQLVNRVGGVEGAIGAVRNLAAEAKGLSLSATSLAQSALGASSSAQSTAQIAQGTALQAQIAANEAKKVATVAANDANEASAQAKQAQSVAQVARTDAKTATQTATEALRKTLEVAVTVATLYALVRAIKTLRGLPGPRGLRGFPGINGTNGTNGTNGQNGITTVVTLPGTPGPKGDRGLPGIRGLRGLPGRNGINGINGRDGVDAVPYNDSGLKAFIAAQHSATRANSTAQHGTTRVTILTPILAAFAPVVAMLKQILDLLSRAADAAQLALLQIINSKLGAQVQGGISGFMRQIGENTYIDKALSVLTFAATVHNALMLSNNLGVTFIAIIDQVTGLIMPKNIEGTPIVLSEVISKSVTALIEGAIGAENYQTLTEQWATANRIYQATANVFNQVVSLGGLLTSATEIIGGNVGKIGNALRKGGVLLENAYQWMNPQPNLKGKFFVFANNAQETLSTVQNVVAVPVGIKDALYSIGESNKDLQREIAQIDPTDGNNNPIKDKEGKIIHYKDGITQPEPTVVKEKAEQAKADSTNFPELVLEDIFDGGD